MSVPGFRPATPAGRRFPVALVVTCVLLAVALVVINVVVLAVLGGLHGSIGRLQDQQAQRRTADAQAQADLQDNFRRADLPGKLAKVRSLTTAANQALITWGSQLGENKPLAPVQDAMNRCDLAIFDYDATAVRLPAGMLAGLPTAIDTNDRATDCGRPH
jgi:predicted lipid-binding transport protein (Tim44 family)